MPFSTAEREVLLQRRVADDGTIATRSIGGSDWACQQITCEWWDEARGAYELFTSELVILEASAGNAEAAARRLGALQGIAGVPIDQEVRGLAEQLVANGGVPPGAEADALHVAVAAVHRTDYLLTWNFRHIDDATTKPVIRSICATAGYTGPEICSPMERLQWGNDDAQG